MSQRRLMIALAEDNLGDVGLVREALDPVYPEYDLIVQSDGEQMLRYIRQIGTGATEPPDLFLLDLNLPRIEGHDLLQQLKETDGCIGVPVVVITSSDSPSDRAQAEQGGARAYFRKPSNYDEFLELGRIVQEVLCSQSGPIESSATSSR